MVLLAVKGRFGKQTIWVCELSIIATSVSTHNIRTKNFFSFYKVHWDSWEKQLIGTFTAFFFFFFFFFFFLGFFFVFFFFFFFFFFVLWIHWGLCLVIALYFLNTTFKNMGISSCYGNQLSIMNNKSLFCQTYNHLKFCQVYGKTDVVLHDINHFIILLVFSTCRRDMVEAKSRIGICL